MHPFQIRRAIGVALELCKRITFQHRLFNCVGMRFRAGTEQDETLYVIFDMVLPDREDQPSYTDFNRAHLGRLITPMTRHAISYDLQGGGRVNLITVAFQDGIAGYVLAQFHAYGEDALLKHLQRWVREALHKAIMHEADEMLLVDGERVFDPHRFVR